MKNLIASALQVIGLSVLTGAIAFWSPVAAIAFLGTAIFLVGYVLEG